MVQLLCKIVWQFLIKLIMHLAYDPAIVLLDIHPRGIKMYVHTKPCVGMLIAALPIIAPNWKHPKYPSVSEILLTVVSPSLSEILLSNNKE